MNFDWGTLFQVQFNFAFFMAMLNIVFINLILSGDNAVLIAMAVRNLEKAIALGMISNRRCRRIEDHPHFCGFAAENQFSETGRRGPDFLDSTQTVHRR